MLINEKPSLQTTVCMMFRLSRSLCAAVLRVASARSIHECATLRDAAAGASGKKTMTVLFGTQTGNSELFARMLTKEAKKKHGYAVTIQDLYEYNPVRPLLYLKLLLTYCRKISQKRS